MKYMATDPKAFPPQEAEWLPTLVRSYAYFEPLLRQKRSDEVHLMKVLSSDQFDEHSKRQAFDSMIGRKYLELIAYNFLVGERQQTEQQFQKSLEKLEKWLQERYRNQFIIILESLSKVFQYQQGWMMRGVKQDLEGLLMLLSSDILKIPVYTDKNQKAMESEDEDEIMSDDDLSMELKPIDLTVSIMTRSTSQMSEQPGDEQASNAIQRTPEKALENKPFLSHLSQKPINRHEPKQQIGQESAATKGTAKASIESLEKRPYATLKAQVVSYLKTMKNHKNQLAQFCRQLGFSNPTYKIESKTEDSYEMHCLMNFTSEYTKFQERHYQAIKTGATARLAEDAAAERVLSMIYTKHEDLWDKFRKIKAAKNIRID